MEVSGQLLTPADLLQGSLLYNFDRRLGGPQNRSEFGAWD